MTFQRFYHSALALPLAVPLVILAGVAFIGAPTSYILRNASTVLLASLLVGGLPYALLALWLASRMRGRSEAEVRRLLLSAPIRMLVVFLPLAALVILVTRAFVGGAVVVAASTLAILIIGYAYVGFVFLLRRLAGARGWIDSNSGVTVPWHDATT